MTGGRHICQAAGPNVNAAFCRKVLTDIGPLTNRAPFILREGAQVNDNSNQQIIAMMRNISESATALTRAHAGLDMLPAHQRDALRDQMKRAASALAVVAMTTADLASKEVAQDLAAAKARILPRLVAAQ
jgi:hypothetical protein